MNALQDLSKTLASKAQGHEFNTRDPSKTAERGGMDL